MNEPKDKVQESDARRRYERPRVVYQDQLSTRAGSPLGAPDGSPFDPANLFGSD